MRVFMGRPITREDIRHPFHWLALGFGAGLAKKAPGTWGSVVGAILFAPAMLLPLWCYALLLLVAAVAGIYICDKTARDWGVGDHGAIVWDEVAGMGIALFALPLTIGSVVMAFAAFRLFDIWKPWPVGALDRSLRGGFGIMMDDLAAGVLAALLCHFVFWVL
ncbi:Phosphatidyl glycerophosphatase A [gamma proteobacterium HdN1]|nr:Phosphatidyl glycerophosphatase A [gamma proteobacterium HdN1]